jgi:replication factor C subunit 1
MELGVGPMVQDRIKIASQDKATFTRLWVDTLAYVKPY